MTNLLYITNNLNGSGGLERVLSIKTNYLINEYNYNIHIAVISGDTNNLFYDYSKKIVFHRIDVKNNKSNFTYFKEVNKIIKYIKPSIVLVCDDGLKAFFAPLFIKTKAPLVYERHASINLLRNSSSKYALDTIRFYLIKFFMIIMARYYDKFVVLTNGNLNEWNNKNCVVIPNPLSFYPDTISNHKSKIVLTVANHGFQKGIDRLLLAWSKIHKTIPDWQLKVFGLKDKDKIYEKMSAELNIENSVSFYSPTKKIEQEYLKSSIYAMPSRSEGFGMVLIEAMACGVPCVSFDCPSGPKDIIDNNENGILVDNDNVNEFADKLKELAMNEDLRIKMSINARIKAKTYMPENILPKWKTLFDSLIISSNL